MAAGSIDALSEPSAGRVADTLRSLVKSLPESAIKQYLEDAAADFQAFTRTRNNLLQTRPALTADGQSRLFRDGDQWTEAEMEAVADAFTGCSERLNRLCALAAPS